HLQIKPGEDASVFAGLIHIILQENLHDQAFCEQWSDGLDSLRTAVQAFTPGFVARRAEIPEEKLLEAARLFASGPRGCASGGLGTEMSRNAELNHYLILALNVVCGRFNRQGERVANLGVMSPPGPLYEGTLPKAQLHPIMSFGTGEQPRVRGLKSICGEMPCNGMADEILTPGDGQVRALICVGGNPVLAFPDTNKTIEAMKDLDLLVSVDPFLSATASLADYIIAPKMPLERDDVTIFGDSNYEQPYAHYAPTVVDAPSRELVEEWTFILNLAAEMGVDMSVNNEQVSARSIHSKYQLLEIITRGSRVPLSRLKDAEGGQVFHDEEASIVQPPIEGLSGRFNLCSDELYEELASLETPSAGPNPNYPLLLIGRRLREVVNSVGQDFPLVQKRYKSNPVFIHPEGLENLGLADKGLVKISSAYGEIKAEIFADKSTKPGVIAMSHSWGRLNDSGNKIEGANINQLTNNAVNFSKNTGMPIMSGIEVRIVKLSEGETLPALISSTVNPS
ncbi:MAG: molybdopterin-containing oxidoreductase family protein, partial [bacterium]